MALTIVSNKDLLQRINAETGWKEGLNGCKCTIGYLLHSWNSKIRDDKYRITFYFPSKTNPWGGNGCLTYPTWFESNQKFLQIFTYLGLWMSNVDFLRRQNWKKWESVYFRFCIKLEMSYTEYFSHFFLEVVMIFTSIYLTWSDPNSEFFAETIINSLTI